LGNEAAGVIEAVGEGVTGFELGRPVSTVPAFSQNDYGVYAERAIVPASAVVRSPEALGAVEGAAVWMPYVTAYGAPIALTRTAAKKKALLKEGAAEVIVTDSEDVVERVRAATGGRGAEFVFDAVVGPGVTDLAKAVADDGMLLVYGALSGKIVVTVPR
jgi:NADPH:quinone reductase-like Zn-dependent oxidoreductase